MTHIEIDTFLSLEFKKQKSMLKNFPNEVKEYLFFYAAKHNWTGILTLSNIYKNIKMGYSTLPKCNYKNCNNQVNIGDKGILSKGCCKKHSTFITNLEKYNTKCAMNTDVQKNKTRDIMLDKYGVAHYSQSTKHKTQMKNNNPFSWDYVKDKRKETLLSRYGVDNPLANTQLKEKYNTTIKARFNVENISQNECIKLKKQNTCMINFGVDCILKINKIKQDGMLKKYGVPFALQSPILFEKAQHNKYKRKEYIWNDGNISIVQGYEPIILNELEAQGYTFNDIETKNTHIPHIPYYFDGKWCIYYPDIFIPSEHLIIEVKSEYTYQADLNKNLAKFKATKQLGYNFKLEIR